MPQYVMSFCYLDPAFRRPGREWKGVSGLGLKFLKFPAPLQLNATNDRAAVGEANAQWGIIQDILDDEDLEETPTGWTLEDQDGRLLEMRDPEDSDAD